MKKIRVVLADDHPFVLLGLRAALVAHTDIEIVGEADSLAGVFELLDATICDVLVTDLMMPAEPGSICDALGYVQRLRFRWPALRVVVVTGLTNEPILKPVALLGVDRIIRKGESLAELASIVRGSKRSGLRDDIAPRIPDDQTVESDHMGNRGICDMHPARARLTGHETLLLRLFVDGYTIDEIATIFGRSVRTISRQKRDAMTKLGVDSDPGLFAFVRHFGLS